jgi:hypothetical protein
MGIRGRRDPTYTFTLTVSGSIRLFRSAMRRSNTATVGVTS